MVTALKSSQDVQKVRPHGLILRPNERRNSEKGFPQEIMRDPAKCSQSPPSSNPTQKPPHQVRIDVGIGAQVVLLGKLLHLPQAEIYPWICRAKVHQEKPWWTRRFWATLSTLFLGNVFSGHEISPDVCHHIDLETVL